MALDISTHRLQTLNATGLFLFPLPAPRFRSIIQMADSDTRTRDHHQVTTDLAKGSNGRRRKVHLSLSVSARPLIS